MDTDLIRPAESKSHVSRGVPYGSDLVPTIDLRTKSSAVDVEDLPGLVHFNRARRELELAASIDEVKQIRDKAEAMRIYASQAKRSLKLQNLCAEIRIRAERKLGEMIKESGIKQNSSANLLRGRSVQPREKSHSLKDFDISKSQSSRYQMIASLSEKEFEKQIGITKESGRELTTGGLVAHAKVLQRSQSRIAKTKKGLELATSMRLGDRVRVVHGDFRKLLSEKELNSDSVDLIVTDPPYSKEYLPLWQELGSFAARVLKPGKPIAAYAALYHLPKIIESLSKSLEYVWIASLIYPSFPGTIHQHHIKTYWKPVLLFSKGKYRFPEKAEWLHDRLEGDGRNKTHHDWEQGLGEASYLIEYFTFPGDLVVDPFVGSGTNALASKRLNRRFLGCDVDEKAVGTALNRIGEHTDKRRGGRKVSNERRNTSQINTPA